MLVICITQSITLRYKSTFARQISLEREQRSYYCECNHLKSLGAVR